MIDYRAEFIKRGLYPLEDIKDRFHKIKCVDKDGYMYQLSYRGLISDKRTKQFNKWDKNNPFKPYNMRLYASRVQDNVIILSSDDELRDATNIKIKFRCSQCGEVYYKKWCHWIGMPLNHHVCPKCNDNPISAGISQYTLLTAQWLDEHRLSYQQEFIFDDCRYKNPLRFDFYVEYKDNIYLIEVDGMQHFYTSTWTTEERLKEIQIRDNIKNEYCHNKGYILVRIPYWLYRHETYKEILYKTFFN